MTFDALRHSRSPLYLQVAEILRQRIASGVWKEGDLLPTLNALAQEFEVAKVTVRQAVKLLEDEGRLKPQRGRGTTVLAQPEVIRPLQVDTHLANLIDMYRNDRPELVHLEAGEADLPPNAEIDQSFDKYQKIRRMHVRDGKRYCIITLYIAKPLYDRYESRLLTELVLPLLFEEPDADVKSAKQTLTIGKCDVETAGHLGLSIGDPVANVRRILRDSQNRVIYLADIVYRGDYIQLNMNLQA